MAKREISSTLRNLKFMQRSALKDEKKKKIDDDEANANFTPSTSSVKKKCVVITDWDPQPVTLLGRMSFQSFNPSIEKLNEEAIGGQKTDASPTSSTSNGGRMSFSEPKVETSQETNGDLKRKQSEGGVSEKPNRPSKSPKSNDKPSPSNKKDNGFKKPKSRKDAWSVLKPPKPQTKN
ncbi:Scarecrow-like transcription factor 11 [Hirschfeldia incana]|nr:Scarecrow-like transcription factor 11 [Hirschfeldia incana]